MNKTSIYLPILLGIIYLICYNNSIVLFIFVNPKDFADHMNQNKIKVKAIDQARRNGKPHISIIDYNGLNETKQVRFKNHLNNFRLLNKLNRTVHMIEIDIKSTSESFYPIYQILDNPYSKIPKAKTPNVFPRLEVWLGKYLKKYKDSKIKPGLKLNVYTRADGIYKILKDHNIDKLGIPIWIGTRGIPGNTDNTNVLEKIYNQTRDFFYDPTLVLSWGVDVVSKDKMKKNILNTAHYVAMLNAIEMFPSNHLVISVRAEILCNCFKKFVDEMIKGSKFKKIVEDNKILSVSYYVEGKLDKKFYDKLLAFSKIYPFFLNVRIVKSSNVYPQIPVKKHTKDIPFFPAKLDFGNMVENDLSQYDSTLGEIIAIDACFVFFVVAMCLLSLVMLIN